MTSFCCDFSQEQTVHHRVEQKWFEVMFHLATDHRVRSTNFKITELLLLVLFLGIIIQAWQVSALEVVGQCTHRSA
jgi:hypothetical protein